MPFQSFFEWLEASAVGESIAISVWMFPAIEVVHVLALVLVVGSIGRLDLRLIGLASRHRSITELSAEVLPWTWISFVVAATTGLLLFASAATRYIENWFFLIKMGLLIAAAINMLVFHFVTYRGVAGWDHDTVPPNGARIAGALSLTFWIAIVVCGRWIGFT